MYVVPKPLVYFSSACFTHILGTLRYQDGELRRGRHCKSKTGTSPVVAAKNKILKIVYF